MPRREVDEAGEYFICGRCRDEFYFKKAEYCGICKLLLTESKLYQFSGRMLRFVGPDNKVASDKIVDDGRHLSEGDSGEVIGEKFFRA